MVQDIHGAGYLSHFFFQDSSLFISGYLFTKDIFKINFRSKLKQVLRAIIIPYFIFVTAMALPKVMFGHSNAHQILIDIIMMRASWFVVAIAVMQIAYTILLWIKPSVINLIVSTGIMFLLGYAFVVLYRDCPDWMLDNQWIQSEDLPNKLPACINLAFIQSPFFALGILFKHSEKYCVLNFTSLIISLMLYVVLYIFIDHLYIGSFMHISTHNYKNILLIFIIGLIGIWALMCISYIIQSCKPFNYIGKNSIIFYFLNGGVITFVQVFMKKITLLDPNNYFNQFLVAVIATALMFPCVWFINKYTPILSGNKDSFNKLSKRLGLKVVW